LIYTFIFFIYNKYIKIINIFSLKFIQGTKRLGIKANEKIHVGERKLKERMQRSRRSSQRRKMEEETKEEENEVCHLAQKYPGDLSSPGGASTAVYRKETTREMTGLKYFTRREEGKTERGR